MSDTPNANTFVKLLNSDNVDILKMRLRSANLMIIALMDTMNVSEVTLPHAAFMHSDGSIETYYDFDADGYVVRRIK